MTKKRFICFSILALLHAHRRRTHRVHQLCHLRKLYSGKNNESNLRRIQGVRWHSYVRSGVQNVLLSNMERVIVCAWHLWAQLGRCKSGQPTRTISFYNSCCVDMRSEFTQDNGNGEVHVPYCNNNFGAGDGPLLLLQQSADWRRFSWNEIQPHSVELFSLAPIRSMCHFTFSKAFTIPIIIIICVRRNDIFVQSTRNNIYEIRPKYTFTLVRVLNRVDASVVVLRFHSFVTEANRNIYWTLVKARGMLVSTRNHFWIWCSTSFHDTF